MRSQGGGEGLQHPIFPILIVSMACGRSEDVGDLTGVALTLVTLAT